MRIIWKTRNGTLAIDLTPAVALSFLAMTVMAVPIA
jgi:hypothetical protein